MKYLRNSFSILFFLHFCFLYPFFSQAKNEKGGVRKKKNLPFKPRLTKRNDYLEKLKKGVGKTVVGFSDDVDSLFGGKSKGKIINRSQLKLSWSVVKAEGEEVSHSPEVDLRLVLPRTEKKLQVVIERKSKQVSDVFQEEEGSKESKTSETVLGDGDSVLTAGVRYILEQRDNWNLYSEGGIKIKIPLQPFAGIGGGRSFVVSEGWSLNFGLSFRWYLDQGLSQTTVLNLDHPFKKRFLFRVANSLTWVDETGQLNTNHGPRLYHKINDRSALRYYISALGKKNPKIHIYSYEGGVYYRKLIYSNWISYETGAKGEYKREDNWEFVPSVSFKLEMLLGGP